MLTNLEEIRNLLKSSLSNCEDSVKFQKELNDRISQLALEVEVLAYSLKNLYEMYEVTQDYAQLLQKRLDPEVFSLVMEEFKENLNSHTRTPRQGISDGEIALTSKIILKAIDKELGTDDIADILNLDVLQTEFALQKFMKPKEENKVHESA